MKPFNRSDWEKFMDRIKHLDIQTLEDTYDKPGGNVVNIRHDVDDDLVASRDMAYDEYKLCIRSTYFILDTAPYWNQISKTGHLRLIHSAHEIGWHNNAITKHLKTGKSLGQCISEPLKILRDICPVIGTASHGDPLCHEKGYLNYNAFREMFPHTKFPYIPDYQFYLYDFGLKYEAYHTGHTHYISDSGGAWQQDNNVVISDFERNGGKLQILLHPQHWQL